MMNPALLSIPRMTFDDGVKITVDGNSIYTGYSTTSVAALLTARPEFTGGGAEINVAVSGQTWRQMNGLDGGSAADVDASIVASGVRNILICAEGTNSADPAKNGGRTGPQIVSDATDYIAARRAVNPSLFVILCSGLPRSPGDATINSALTYSDLAYRLSPAGADMFVDMRGLPFANHNGLLLPNFEAYATRWADAPAYVHPSASGVGQMVDLIAATLLSIPAGAVAVT